MLNLEKKFGNVALFCTFAYKLIFALAILLQMAFYEMS